MKFIFALALLLVSVDGFWGKLKDKLKEHFNQIIECEEKDGCLTCPRRLFCMADGKCYGWGERGFWNQELHPNVCFFGTETEKALAARKEEETRQAELAEFHDVEVGGWLDDLKDKVNNLFTKDEGPKKCYLHWRGCYVCPNKMSCRTDGNCYNRFAHPEEWKKYAKHENECLFKYWYRGTEKALADDLEGEVAQVADGYKSKCNDQYSCKYTDCTYRSNKCPKGTKKTSEAKSDCWFKSRKHLCCKDGPNKAKAVKDTTHDGATCIFPFVYKDTEYCDCTDVYAFGGGPKWCYTKADRSHYGTCHAANYVPPVAHTFMLTTVHHTGNDCGGKTAVAVMTKRSHGGNCVQQGDRYEQYHCNSNGKLSIDIFLDDKCKTKDEKSVPKKITSGTCLNRSGYSMKYLFDCIQGSEQKAPALSKWNIGYDIVHKKDVDPDSGCPGTGGTVDVFKSSHARFVPYTCYTMGTTSVKYSCRYYWGQLGVGTQRYSDPACTRPDGHEDMKYRGCILQNGESNLSTFHGCGSVEEDEEHALSSLQIENKRLKKLLLEMK